jgi:hypothetical protein
MTEAKEPAQPLDFGSTVGLGAGSEARYLRQWQVYALCVLGVIGGVLCFWMWAGAVGLGPFAGMLIGVSLPFAGAMVAGAK